MKNETVNHLEALKYPAGKFKAPEAFTKELLTGYIKDISAFPSLIKAEVSALGDKGLGLQYRPGSWTIRQIVHHCADSHMNAFIRFKLALTEDNPTVKPYVEQRWAELSDSLGNPGPSLQILEGLHARWTDLLLSIDKDALKRTFFHPEHKKEVKLEEVLGLYAWHGNHHLAHIKQAKKNISPSYYEIPN